MICTMKELLDDAVQTGKAVGGFNVANMECIAGVIRAAQEMNTPVILQIAEKRMEHSPLEYMGPMMVEAAKAAKVKVAVHLDHGKSMDVVRKALEYGFTSVMFDGSDYSLKDNIRLTNQVYETARLFNATVEAELGVLGGNEGDGEHQVLCTDVAEAIQFADEANIDALAIAIGNAHGHYQGQPKLQMEVLRAVASRIQVPLVLHGGTGISDKQFWECISSGIRKINIATANFDAIVNGAADYLKQNVEHNYFGLNESMTNHVCEQVKQCIQVFNNETAAV